LQEREINKIRNGGGQAWLVNEENVEQLYDLLGGLYPPHPQ
jgi:hypothetical protein